MPELISVFKEAADVQTSDMLQLPVPETVYEDVVLNPSEEQRDMVAALGERAEQVRNRLVAPKEDNMLKITSDGRKLAFDQRLMNDMLPDDPNSKVNACVERVFSIWEEGKAERTTQLLFCDLSTPKGGTAHSMCMTTSGKSWWQKVFPVRRYASSMRRTPKRRRLPSLPGCAAVKPEC